MAYWVYIMASQRNGTLYVGSTNDLLRRVFEHRERLVPSFTSRYGVTRLVYYEQHDVYESAAQREKRLKKWKREWKIALIEDANPTWRDLYEEICI